MADSVTASDELIIRAYEALNRGDWNASESLFVEALEQKETPEAFEGLGRRRPDGACSASVTEPRGGTR